jgi:hypothetical protein
MFVHACGLQCDTVHAKYKFLVLRTVIKNVSTSSAMKNAIRNVMWQWTPGFYKMGGISWVAEELATQEGLGFTEWVGSSVS